jgi:hypothetical protein
MAEIIFATCYRFQDKKMLTSFKVRQIINVLFVYPLEIRVLIERGPIQYISRRPSHGQFDRRCKDM